MLIVLLIFAFVGAVWIGWHHAAIRDLNEQIAELSEAINAEHIRICDDAIRQMKKGSR